MTRVRFDDLPPDVQDRLVQDYPDLEPLVPRRAAASAPKEQEPPLQGRPNRLLLAASIACLMVGWTLCQLSRALLWTSERLRAAAYALPRPQVLRPVARGLDRTGVRAARSAYGLTPRFRRMP